MSARGEIDIFGCAFTAIAAVLLSALVIRIAIVMFHWAITGR